MRKYRTPVAVPPEVHVDPNSGFLCLEMHWRPNPADPDPNMPGQKLSTSSFIPALPQTLCLCGSGKRFAGCCQRRPVWWPLCPNPEGIGYSLVAPQAATFRGFDRTALRERLAADRRLHLTVNEPDEGFWIFWGDPPVEDDYGVVCYGDIQLHADGRLEVTAMSELRMRVLMELVQEAAGDLLGTTEVQPQPIPVIDKMTNKTRMLPTHGQAGERGRRGRPSGRR